MSFQFPPSLRRALEKHKNNPHATKVLIEAWQLTAQNDTPPLSTRSSFNSLRPQRNFAFSFDIDGVLHRGEKILPHASAVMNFLLRNNIPFIFLTNSGGQTESERIKNLSKKLKAPLRVEQFVQSHTPVKLWLEAYGKQNCLVIGGVGDKVRLTCESYGFENVLTTADLKVAYPQIWPFGEIAEALPRYYHEFARGLPSPINPSEPETGLKISAVFIFSSSRDWGLDLQIIIDLLLSEDGRIGARHSCQHQQGVELIFCNPDLEWSTVWEQPRLAQGAFKAALRGIWHDLTGKELRYTEMGKPTQLSFEYGEQVLNQYRDAFCDASLPLKTVYHIGDSETSDILGANSFKSKSGVAWQSILVETGIYEAGTAPKFTPHACVPNVRDALNWALKAQGWSEGVTNMMEEEVPELGGEEIAHEHSMEVKKNDGKNSQQPSCQFYPPTPPTEASNDRDGESLSAHSQALRPSRQPPATESIPPHDQTPLPQILSQLGNEQSTQLTREPTEVEAPNQSATIVSTIEDVAAVAKIAQEQGRPLSPFSKFAIWRVADKKAREERRAADVAAYRANLEERSASWATPQEGREADGKQNTGEQ